MGNTKAVQKADTIGTDLVKICHVFLIATPTDWGVSCLAHSE